eukprot:3052635-Pyramimonas_sp.AAC.1
MLRRTLVVRDLPSKRALKQLMKSTHFDDNVGGHALFEDSAPLALKKGSRLIERGLVADLHDLFSIDEFPTSLASILQCRWG